MRVMIEEANGLNSAGGGAGHAYLDCTNKPMPTIQAQRPVKFYVEESRERERERVS